MMDDFLEQFLIESRELTTQLTDDLAALERAPRDRERLDRIFRAFHTLKGAAGIVDFHPMGQLMHLAEDALTVTRSGQEPVSQSLIKNCFGCLDLVESWLTEIVATEALPRQAASQIGRLRKDFGGGENIATHPHETSQEMNSPPAWLKDFISGTPVPTGAVLAIRYTPDPSCFFQGRDPLGIIAGLPGLCGVSVQPRQSWPAPEEIDPFECNIVIYAYTTASTDQISDYTALPGAEVEIARLGSRMPGPPEPLRLPAALILQAQVTLLNAVSAKEASAGRISSAGKVAYNVLSYLGLEEAAQTVLDAASRSVTVMQAEVLIRALQSAISLIETPGRAAAGMVQPNWQSPGETTNALRVDVRRIDAIVKLTSELTVVKNAVGHVNDLLAGGSSRESVAQALKVQHANLERLINELQRSVLAIRVLPLRHVFRRFPRLVKEIASTVGKAVELVTDGDDTEADKLVVESLVEPLLHVLRNAVDHGIEAREPRSAAGKSDIAVLRLSGSRDGDHVIIEVKDDGRGIDPAALAKVALARGLITQEALEAMTREEMLDLVFLPGFSTAEKVTDLSGRGVGMDAVRTAVEQFGGTASIQTELTVGTTVRFTLPFSVMMTRIMTVEAGGQMFGLPFESIIEMLHLPREYIVPVGAAQAIVFRGQTIPFVSLPMTLGGSKATTSAKLAKIVIARIGGQLGALEVDRFGERMDLMLSPRTGLLSGVAGIAGTTLLGDGRVLIVLELQELLQ
jgi:two-component system chemotaxis sensor kinase CheA